MLSSGSTGMLEADEKRGSDPRLGSAAPGEEGERGGRIVVVSNRLPLTLRWGDQGWRAEASSGGLVTAMRPVLHRTGGLWIGWPGESGTAHPDSGKRDLLARWEREKALASVDISADLAQRFYFGYANQTLWPLFHEFPSRLRFDPEGWEAYMEANRHFRDAVLERLRPGDLVWIHDYHLMLLPKLLREAVPDATIGFFLHIPFPSPNIFRVLPRREELLRGLLGADLVAFQTHGHLQHFRASLLRVLGLESRMDRVPTGGRFVRIEALPIGIAPGEFTAELDRAAVRKSLDGLRERFDGRRIVLAVDRLDYTKGIPERLRAFRRALRSSAGLRGEVVLIQIAPPSRERIEGYRDLRREVNELVGEINGEFGTPDWTPVLFIRRSVARPELVALYAAAEVCWVSPLRDGMNLVAKEYVTCQRGEGGVLLLSEFAGAAAEMGEALLVNPYDEEGMAAALGRGLAMSAEERRERMGALYRRVVRNDAIVWSARFVEELRLSAQARISALREVPRPLDRRELVRAYRSAARRLLFLDYDGTLVAFADRPLQAAPPDELVSVLGRLSAGEDQRVVIVSGRPRRPLEAWFGRVAGLWLAAEHGATVRDPASGQWTPLRPTVPREWKLRVLPVLGHFVDRTPGSFVEEKEYSLVWHYRMADPEFGDWLANELVATLDDLLTETELRAVRRQKAVEVRPAWAHKGEVVQQMSAAWSAEFVLGVGDDRTDEDLFERLPTSAWTIHVGEGASLARFRLDGPPEVCDVLRELAEAGRVR
jgi:trehalose 6-phosphate synthase/phosphatase